MADEWRVSLVLSGAGGAPKNLVRDLRGRLGDDVAVSADRGHVFLYAGTAKAAEEAGHVALEALTLAGLTAQSLIEYWDPAVQAWRDPLVEISEDDREEARRQSHRAKVVDSVLQILTDAPPSF